MKKIYVVSLTFIVITILSCFYFFGDNTREKNYLPEIKASKYREHKEITGDIKKGDTLSGIFRKYKLKAEDLFKIREASASLHKVRNLLPGQPYKIVLDDNNQINSFSYWIDDDTVLNITNTDEGFCAKKTVIQYEERIEYIGGVIKDNLVSSIGEENGGLPMALELSDIFAWDIDFLTDTRNNDTYKVIVKGLYLDGKLKKYGDIIAAEIVNNGRAIRAYRYIIDGKTDYYDEEGRSLKKVFLKAPLTFRRISSFFSGSRQHPILKIHRHHYGIDYAAPTGTPVSASGDGKIIFSGCNGQFGNLVVVKHRNNFKTYYGHLSTIAKDIRKGTNVEQGQLIGNVGATGLATGPHLHYEMRVDNKPVNPLSVKTLRGGTIPGKMMAKFELFKDKVDIRLASNEFGTLALAKNETLSCR